MAAKYDVPDDEIDKITHENAMRWYRFDPFRHPAAGEVHGGGPAGRGRRPRRVDPVIRQGPLREIRAYEPGSALTTGHRVRGRGGGRQ